jgi:hypothetical protein
MTRQPRPATNINLPATFADQVEAEILATMRDWPRQMEERLKTSGLEDFSGGHLLWQAKCDCELTNPDPHERADAVATVIWLAGLGHACEPI